MDPTLTELPRYRGTRRETNVGAPRKYAWDLLEVGASLLVPWRTDERGVKLEYKRQHVINTALDCYEAKSGKSFFRAKVADGLYVRRLK